MLVFEFSETEMGCEGKTGSDVTWTDILDPSLLQIVSEHWLNFSPPSKSEHFILGSLYVILMSTGLAANGTIILLFSR